MPDGRQGPARLKDGICKGTGAWCDGGLVASIKTSELLWCDVDSWGRERREDGLSFGLAESEKEAV